jgi:hypothetical protein
MLFTSEKIRSTAILEEATNGAKTCKNDRVVGEKKIKRKSIRD